jgi:hypothetical protein
VTVLLDGIASAVAQSVVVAGAVFDADTFALVEVVSGLAFAAWMTLGVTGLVLWSIFHPASLWAVRSALRKVLILRTRSVCKPFSF